MIAGLSIPPDRLVNTVIASQSATTCMRPNRPHASVDSGLCSRRSSHQRSAAL